MMDKFIAGNDMMDEIVKVRYTGGNDGVLFYHEVYPVVGEKGDRLILETFYNGEPFHIEVDKSVCAPHSVEMKGKATPFEKIEKKIISLGSLWQEPKEKSIGIEFSGEKDVEEDLINEPNHYHKGGIDIYGIMGAKFNEEKEKGFCIGNVLKYVIRHEMKGTPLQDLQKARFNLDRLIELVERELKE